MWASSSFSAGGSLVIENVVMFFPFATTTLLAFCARSSASFLESLALASTVSVGVSFFFARNSCDLVQEVHPLRW